MKSYDVFWAPTGAWLCSVYAQTESAAKRKAPAPYRKFLGELYVKETTKNKIRKEAANLARASRSMYPHLQGEWSRKAWNDQVRITIKHFIDNTTKFWSAN